eukprot:scaffold4316_cov76-Amphora_coffeaeformis.AAC.1
MRFFVGSPDGRAETDERSVADINELNCVGINLEFKNLSVRRPDVNFENLPQMHEAETKSSKPTYCTIPTTEYREIEATANVFEE